MPSFDQPWRPILNWENPAGWVIDRLVDALPADRPWKIILFDSSPLQLALDGTFVSGDVDIIPPEDVEDYCRRAGLLKGQAAHLHRALRSHGFYGQRRLDDACLRSATQTRDLHFAAPD